MKNYFKNKNNAFLSLNICYLLFLMKKKTENLITLINATTFNVFIIIYNFVSINKTDFKL